MREIKFRVWNKKVKVMTFSEKENCCSWDSESFDNPPIMQFTGLKDKHGKEIYEGDILQWIRNASCMKYDLYKEYGIKEKQTYTVVVKYYGGRFGCAGKVVTVCDRCKPSIGNWTDRSGFGYFEEKEVIGNIYENPELLE